MLSLVPRCPGLRFHSPGYVIRVPAKHTVSPNLDDAQDEMRPGYFHQYQYWIFQLQ